MEQKPGQKVAILGASPRADRYSNIAFHMLREYGHSVLPIAPAITDLEGVPVFRSVSDINERVDTLTMYVGPQISSGLVEDIVKLKPGRVIFNPGTENPMLQTRLAQAGIGVEVACTLVLLRTHQF